MGLVEFEFLRELSRAVAYPWCIYWVQNLQSSCKVPTKFLQSSCKVPVRLANHIKAFEWVAFTVSAGVCGSWWWCGVEVHQVGLLRLFLKLDVFGHD